MSANPQGTNAFATYGTPPGSPAFGGGMGLRTADPNPYLGTSTQAPFGQYSPWQGQVPGWIGGALQQSVMPIQNYPITNFGRWNYGTSPYGMPGAVPGPVPAPGGNPQAPPPATGGPPPTQPPPPAGTPPAPPWTGGPPPPWTGGPMPPTPGAPPVSSNPFAAFQPSGGGSPTANRVIGGVNYGPGPLSPTERGQVTNAMQQQLQSTWPGMTEQQRYAALQQNPALQGILYKNPQLGGFNSADAVKSWFASQAFSNPGADVQRLGTQFWNR